ncbi:MAG: asparagine--tRNA ligase [Planctomycetales bacterium]
MDTLSVAAAREESSIGQQAMLQGWVRTRRDSKAGFSFLEINDGSCLANIQIICDGDLENYEAEIRKLSAGCSVTVTGEVKPSVGKGQATELHASAVTVHGWADPEQYPLQKKRHSFEKLREWAHLRPRTNTFGAVARVSNTIARSIHNYFQEQQFLYVNTPIITASDCEGAGEMFRVTTLDLEQLAKKETTVNKAFDFYDRPANLTVSGQLEGEIYATALGKIYTFGPTFRAENSNTSRHLAEFWMVEPEVAFAELPQNMDLAEGLIKRIFNDVLQDSAEDMQFFNDRIDNTVIETLESIGSSQFERISYTEAINLLEQAKTQFEFTPEWGQDLQSEHERYLTEEAIGRPVIVSDYPSTIKPFYMRLSDDEKTVAAMDVLVPKVGEIIGGSQREDRLDVLTQRMERQDLDPETYWWYLDLRRFGTVPHAGFGLGLERIVQFTTGMANIRDVIPFPRTPGSAEF